MTEKLLFWGIIVFLFATLGIGMWAAKQVKRERNANLSPLKISNWG